MTATNPPQENKSAAKVFAVLDVLLRNFFHGYTPSELAAETKYSASDITRYVHTLVSAGYAERIQETGRIRPSIKFAQSAMQILHAVEAAEHQVNQLKQRINRN